MSQVLQNDRLFRFSGQIPDFDAAARMSGDEKPRIRRELNLLGREVVPLKWLGARARLQVP
jgi:hypothetical protein